MGKLREILSAKDFWRNTWILPSGLFGISAFLLTFIEIENVPFKKIWFLLILIFITILWFLYSLIKNYRLKEASLNIDGSKIEIKEGNIFSYPRNVYKVIAFNEFLDTCVDDKIISSRSLNGQYLKNFCSDIEELDQKINQDPHMQSKIIGRNVERPLGGKDTRYQLGSIYKEMDFFLVAFSKFDAENKAGLKLHEYANCLINFWNEVNNLYSQHEVVVPLLGSGITRHKDFDATSHQLLEVMLWTFKISKVKFREPAKITILLHKSHYEKINFYKLKEFEKNGL